MHINSRHLAPRILGVAFFLLLSACTAVGPNYQPPQQEMPGQWQATDTNVTPTAGLLGGNWWAMFDDQILSAW